MNNVILSVGIVVLCPSYRCAVREGTCDRDATAANAVRRRTGEKL